MAEYTSFRGDYDRALDELRHPGELNPSDAEAQSGLRTHVVEWQYRAAIETMREVGRAQPILTDDEYVDLRIAYLIADRPDDAEGERFHDISWQSLRCLEPAVTPMKA